MEQNLQTTTSLIRTDAELAEDETRFNDFVQEEYGRRRVIQNDRLAERL